MSADEAVALASQIPGAHLELIDGEAHVHTAGDSAALAARICAFTSGGRERTGTEYRHLLDEAGLELTAILPTATAFSVIEATVR